VRGKPVLVEGCKVTLCEDCAKSKVGFGGVLVSDAGFGLDGYPVKVAIKGGKLVREYNRGGW
jgi:hypothetical protein